MTELAEDSSQAIVRTIAHISKFSNPLSKKLSFEETFSGPFNEKTMDVLEVASKRREALMSSLTYGGSTPDPRAIVAACKEYYPTVWCITESMVHGSDEPVKMKNKYKFSWTSVLDRRGRVSHWTNPAFVFEMAEILTLQALQTSNVAANCSAAEDYVSAAKLLREAAGILIYVADTLLPKWESTPALVPFEVNSSVLKALAKVMQAQAQQMAIAKVLSSGKKLPSSLLSKLFVGCISYYEDAAGLLRKLPKDDFDQLDTLLLEVCGFLPKVLHATALKLLAVDYYEKGKYGYAATYAQVASKHVSRIAKLKSDQLHNIQPSVSALISSCQETANNYVEENTTIYFEVTPDLPLPPIESKSMDVSPTEFKTPAVAYISFDVIKSAAGLSPKKSMTEAVSSFFSRKKSGEAESSSKGADKEIEKNAETLVAMGFEKSAAIKALKQSNNDMSAAVDILGNDSTKPAAPANPSAPPASSNSSSDLETKVQMCVSMGFDAQAARKVLPTVDYDVSKAIDKLCVAGASAPPSTETKQNESYGDTLEIELPPGVSSGQMISVKDPRDGQIYRVQVPPGAGAGTKMQIQTMYKK